jgi:hypothetical protein
VTEFNHLVLSDWNRSGYQYIVCTIRDGQAILRPVRNNDFQLEQGKSFLLSIHDDVIIKASKGRNILGYQFMCDAAQP